MKKNYLCEIKRGKSQGEQFFAQADTYEEAVKIAREVDKSVYVYKRKWFRDDEAEMMGLDTY